ncbi:hypothetical protein QRX25_09090 [Bacillus sp. L381]|uniref:hypothetical protein n=1 Tax=Bacillus TaxID=1386 RepID=UPI00201164CD|nr:MULTISPECIES: hypothetical protein [Bacillus]MCR9038361.1 hypothetical protein [Bacillus velezensis]WIX23514.1 hypothetical protein QRX25_09090 [Bacillus sp. L381]
MKDAEGQGRLAAYIVPKVTDISLLCQSIMQELPAYMMPSHIIGLDSMPLALNGKLDKSALSAGEIHSAQTSNIMFHRFRSPLKKPDPVRIGFLIDLPARLRFCLQCLFRHLRLAAHFEARKK